jgi:ribosomal protein S28E/S33
LAAIRTNLTQLFVVRTGQRDAVFQVRIECLNIRDIESVLVCTWLVGVARRQD